MLGARLLNRMQTFIFFQAQVLHLSIKRSVAALRDLTLLSTVISRVVAVVVVLVLLVYLALDDILPRELRLSEASNLFPS